MFPTVANSTPSKRKGWNGPSVLSASSRFCRISSSSFRRRPASHRFLWLRKHFSKKYVQFVHICKALMCGEGANSSVSFGWLGQRVCSGMACAVITGPSIHQCLCCKSNIVAMPKITSPGHEQCNLLAAPVHAVPIVKNTASRKAGEGRVVRRWHDKAHISANDLSEHHVS